MFLTAILTSAMFLRVFGLTSACFLLFPEVPLKFYSQILIQGTALAIVDFEFSRLPHFCCDMLGSVTRPEQF